jgi:hypothetical protein
VDKAAFFAYKICLSRGMTPSYLLFSKYEA